jgi:hypothetical protein
MKNIRSPLAVQKKSSLTINGYATLMSAPAVTQVALRNFMALTILKKSVVVQSDKNPRIQEILTMSTFLPVDPVLRYIQSTYSH